MATKELKSEETYEKVSFKGKSVEGMTLYGTDTYVMKCVSGKARVLIGSTECEFGKGTNFFLADEVLFKFLGATDDLEILAFKFSSRFFNVVYPLVPGEAIETISQTSPYLYNSESKKLLDLAFRQIQILYGMEKKEYTYLMTVNLLVNYVLIVHEQTYGHTKEDVPVFPNDRTTALASTFYELVRDGAVEHRNVEYYAKRLNISSRYLFKICKANGGMSPKQAIDYVIVGKTKKLLLTTGLSFLQISTELLFPNQTAFTEYFKRNVGITPSEFRKKYL